MTRRLDVLEGLDIRDTNARSCGSCRLCCTVLGVAELEKPPCTVCRHLRGSQAAGGGCSILCRSPGQLPQLPL